jgi:hypothetical protein
LKIKLKGRHFDTTEMTEAKSQAMLNTLIQHDVQDVIKKKKRQKHRQQCIRMEGNYFEGDCGQ